MGVINNYLNTEYGINIENDYFKKKTYVLLIDSLDESGELTERNIDNVIASVKRIQQLDQEKYRNNRILITSRPIDEGLKKHLTAHQPYEKEIDKQKITFFISIHGFKKEQFNHWLIQTLKNDPKLKTIEITGYVKEIIDKIKKNEQLDIYGELVSKKILSENELRRPIFAYMLYQLITRNVDFSATGKVGIYLSFLNLLTKEAKHKEDKTVKVNLREEFRFRNILHATACWWTYQRQMGQQGTLKKLDICQTIEGKPMDAKEAIDKYREVVGIEFLSHSYFGEDGDNLHFQHQSLAEMLLAEYYLKVFIKYALDDDSSIEDARIRLVIGDPTEQTVSFFKELLQLLKETASKEHNPEIIEKRKLLVPLMASLATTEYGRNLFSYHISYNWYKKIDFKEGQTEINEKHLKKWPIDSKALEKIIDLSKEILEAETNYAFTKAEPKTVLYNKEVLTLSKRLNDMPPDMDRWLALLTGNELFNNEKGKLFFASQIKNFRVFFDMIRNWNYAFSDSAPSWGKKLFRGMDMSDNNNTLNLSYSNFGGIDFSYSYLKRIEAYGSKFMSCFFVENSFHHIDFASSSFERSTISQIKLIRGSFEIDRSKFSWDLVFPSKLCKSLPTDRGSYISYGSRQCTFGKDYIDDFKYSIPSTFRVIEGLLVYILQHKDVTVDEIKTWFAFEKSGEAKRLFFKKIDELKKYEKAKAKPKSKKKVSKKLR